jgi:hypothetical protein
MSILVKNIQTLPWLYVCIIHTHIDCAQMLDPNCSSHNVKSNINEIKIYEEFYNNKNRPKYKRSSYIKNYHSVIVNYCPCLVVAERNFSCFTSLNISLVQKPLHCYTNINCLPLWPGVIW